MSTVYQELPTDEEISRRAYELWLSRGCPEGDGADDWETAKAELITERQQNGSSGGLLGWWSRFRGTVRGRDM